MITTAKQSRFTVTFISATGYLNRKLSRVLVGAAVFDVPASTFIERRFVSAR